jgi:MoxR-like ATPase
MSSYQPWYYGVFWSFKMNAVLAMPKQSVKDSSTVKDKFLTVRRELGESLIERSEEIDLLLTGLIAGEHLLLVGPPGCGKSLLIDSLMRWTHGSKFSCLLNRFSMPEEILGMYSLSELKVDKFVRITTNKLPESQYVFLDEIFRASPAILNVLLKILHEKTFDKGDGVARRVPLEICLGAANDWPSGDDAKSLGALVDRFMLRKSVAPIGSSAGRQRLLWNNQPPEFSTSLSAHELIAARLDSQGISWSKEAKVALESIFDELARQGVKPSDRRIFKSVAIVQAFAWLNGSEEILSEHLEVLQHVLWTDHAEEASKVRAVIMTIAAPISMKVNGLISEIEQILAGVNPKDLGATATAASKLSEIQKSLKAMKEHPKALAALAYLKEKITELRLKSLDSI